MKNRLLLIISLTVLCMFPYVTYSIAYMQGSHEEINKKAATEATMDESSFQSYLVNALGYEGGLQAPLYGYSERQKQYVEQSIEDWLAEGGIQEDEPSDVLSFWYEQGRANNHFHNPLKHWSEG